MAQLERTRKPYEGPLTPRTSPISDHLHLADQEEFQTPAHSLSQGGGEQDDANASHNKKSVLTKVKESAKKLRHSLSAKSRRHGNVHITPPQYHVASNDTDALGDADDEFDEDPDQDAEYLGAPMYESAAAPENLKEHARQHPRAEPVLQESHKVPTEALNENNKPTNPNLTTTMEAASDAANKITSKLTGVTEKTPEAKHTTQNAAQETEGNRTQNTVPPNTGNQNQHGASSLQTDDDSAVSWALDEAMSPVKTTGETTVVDMVKEAVYSVFDREAPSNSTAKTAPATSSSSSATIPDSSNISISRQQNQNLPNANSARRIPFSDKNQEVVEEENHGKILQAN